MAASSEYDFVLVLLVCDLYSVIGNLSNAVQKPNIPCWEIDTIVETHLKILSEMDDSLDPSRAVSRGVVEGAEHPLEMLEHPLEFSHFLTNLCYIYNLLLLFIQLKRNNFSLARFARVLTPSLY